MPPIKRQIYPTAQLWNQNVTISSHKAYIIRQMIMFLRFFTLFSVLENMAAKTISIIPYINRSLSPHKNHSFANSITHHLQSIPDLIIYYGKIVFKQLIRPAFHGLDTISLTEPAVSDIFLKAHFRRGHHG